MFSKSGLDHSCIIKSGASLMLACLLMSLTPNAFAGIVNINFTSLITIGGVEEDVDGTFVLDDDRAFDDSIVGGQVDIGGDIFTVVVPSGFTFVAVGSNAFGFNADYGTQGMALELFSDALVGITDPFAALLSLTLDDLIPYSATNPSTSNFFFAGQSEFVTGPITSFSVTTAVPEPATTALLTVGLALLGLGYRRRRAVI